MKLMIDASLFSVVFVGGSGSALGGDEAELQESRASRRRWTPRMSYIGGRRGALSSMMRGLLVVGTMQRDRFTAALHHGGVLAV